MKNEHVKNMVAMNMIAFWKDTDLSIHDVLIDVNYSDNNLAIKIFDRTDIDNSITLTISNIVKPNGICNYHNMSMLAFTEVVNKYGLTVDEEKGDA